MSKSYFYFICIIFLSSCKSDYAVFDEGEIIKKYTTKEINYFYETTFYQDGVYEKMNHLNKWRQKIFVFLTGDFTNEDLNFAQNSINQINLLNLPISIEIIKNEEKANVWMFFGEQEEFSRKFQIEIEDNAKGIGVTKSIDGEISRAYIGIFKSDSKLEKHSIILEELVQILGVQGDSYTYRDSVFYEKPNTVNSILEIDKKVLALLYEKSIPLNLNRVLFEKKLGKILYPINFNNKFQNFLTKNKINNSKINFIRESCFVKNQFHRFSNEIPISLGNGLLESDIDFIEKLVKEINSHCSNIKLDLNKNESNLVDGIFINIRTDDSISKAIEANITVEDGKSMYPKRWKGIIDITTKPTISIETQLRKQRVLLNLLYRILGPFNSSEKLAVLADKEFETLDLLYSSILPDGLHIDDFNKSIYAYENSKNKN